MKRLLLILTSIIPFALPYTAHPPSPIDAPNNISANDDASLVINTYSDKDCQNSLDGGNEASYEALEHNTVSIPHQPNFL
jgi:hypothetical protein